MRARPLRAVSAPSGISLLIKPVGFQQNQTCFLLDGYLQLRVRVLGVKRGSPYV